MRGLTIGVVVLVVLAGCNTLSPPNSPAQPTQSADYLTSTGTSRATPTSSVTPSSEDTPVRTITQSTSTPFPNPYHNEIVTVAVGTNPTNYSYASLVNRSLEFWNEHVENHGPYQVVLKYTGYAAQADIRIDFVENISRCGIEGGNTDSIGCAEFVPEGTTVGDRTVVARVEAGRPDRGIYTNQTVQNTITHEIGHTLGFTHNAALAVMAATAPVVRQSNPQLRHPNYTWNKTNLDVTITVTRDYDGRPSTAKSEISDALDYYDQDPDDFLGPDVDFTIVSDPARADIHITVGDRAACPDTNREYCIEAYYTHSPIANRTYTSYNLTLSNLDETELEFYTGFFLTDILTFREDRPPQYSLDRRS